MFLKCKQSEPGTIRNLTKIQSQHGTSLNFPKNFPEPFSPLFKFYFWFVCIVFWFFKRLKAHSRIPFMCCVHFFMFNPFYIDKGEMKGWKAELSKITTIWNFNFQYTLCAGCCFGCERRSIKSNYHVIRKYNEFFIGENSSHCLKPEIPFIGSYRPLRRGKNLINNVAHSLMFV